MPSCRRRQCPLAEGRGGLNHFFRYYLPRQLAELCAEVADGTCFQGVLDFAWGRKPLCTIHVAGVYADFRRHRSEISSQLQPTRPLRPV